MNIFELVEIMAIYFYKIKKHLIKKRNLIYFFNISFYLAITILPVFSTSINLFKKDKENNPNKLKESSFLISNIIWEKQVKSRQENSIIKWERLPTERNQGKDINKISRVKKKKLIINTINSNNRSIIINNEVVGPDVSWIVPLGFKWNKKYKFDVTARGHNTRIPEPKNKKFFAWNDGDAVGLISYQFLHNEKSSFGLNVGVRSLYQGNQAAGGSTGIASDGNSAGFRWDYKLSELSGIAFGAEQLIHFDNLTDSGRNIYLTASKAWLSEKDEGHNSFPLYVATAGVATGRMAVGTIRGFCSEFLGGSGTEVNNYHNLCWSPVFSVASVLNKKFSTYFEYNSRFFLVGTSYAPLKNIPLRGNFALILSDHVDNYKIHDGSEMNWVFNLSLGF